MLRLFYSKSRSAGKKACSELLFGDQLISECDKAIHGRNVSHLTFSQYQEMDTQQKSRLNNCVQQWALKARDSLPNDQGVFCLVSHLLKNAHRYFQMEGPYELQTKVLQERNISDDIRQQIIEDFKEANKNIRAVGDLKS